MTNLATLDPYDWQTIAPHFMALLSEPLTPDQVPGWLARWSQLETALREAENLATRAKNADTNNLAAAQCYQHFVTVIAPQREQAAQALKSKLLAIEGFEPEDEHRMLLRRWRSEAALYCADNVPLRAAVLARASDYFTLTGTMTVRLGGTEQTMAEAAQRLLDPDRRKRELVWRTLMTRRLQDRDTLHALFLDLLPQRQQIAHNAGFPEYRAYKWQELQRFDYGPADNLALHTAIEAEIVPLALRLAEQRRARLGVETVRPWDTTVDPSGQPPLCPFTSATELEAGVGSMLTRVDPVLGAFFQRLRGGFLDLQPRPGKAQLAYAAFLPQTGMPYIFMNAVGAHYDVQTLLHEAGHALHWLEMDSVRALVWNTDTPEEFGEVAAQALELLALPYLAAGDGGFYTPEDARRARHQQLEAIIWLLRDTALGDAFQHWVYTEAPVDVTPTDLEAQWVALSQRFFPEIDWSELEPEQGIGWHTIPHFFVWPFYVIEYTLAWLGALQIWQNALQDQALAVRQYRAALALGGTRSLPLLYAAAGARLAFDHGTVGTLASFLATQLGLL